MTALTALGYSPTLQGNMIRTTLGSIDTRTGKFTGQFGSQEETITQKIKQAYSGEVVKATARKHGWQLKSTGQNKFEIIKNTI